MKRLISDWVFIVGAVLVVRGAWLAWPPAAWLIAGGLLLVWSMGLAKQLETNKQRGNDK